jgi:hypothetical protein
MNIINTLALAAYPIAAIFFGVKAYLGFKSSKTLKGPKTYEPKRVIDPEIWLGGSIIVTGYGIIAYFLEFLK